MAQQVAGKTAIVTGAGSGIGLAFSSLLLSHGCNVLFADLTLRPEASALIAQYPSQTDTTTTSSSTPTPNQPRARALFQQTDVISWPSLTTMFTAATTHLGPVSIVCPAAGIFEPNWTNFWHPPGSSESKDDPNGGRYKLFDINLTHPIRVTQMAIAHFLEETGSAAKTNENPKTLSIVHIASVAAQIATIMFPMYCVSKHGIQAFVRCLGDLEASHGIRVTAVDPGIVKTPIWTEDPGKNKVLSEDDGWVTPEEVAEVMLACVRDEEVGSGMEGEERIRIQGGTCLEVLAGTVRDVPLYGNVGPFALGRKGAEAGNPETLKNEVLGLLKPGWGTV